ncbi:MarR family transcriptional regulator [Methanosarcina sp.]|jgi:DNA-binding MarR family transcriptional regulator|uniref:MarR family winged helix-turn-helix transcriptional regulator n=1 Tax=Methanosarcina sp. TaxID=2213 RepID=UPI002C01364C|nr:MarR family transcriptional regulator [Methanosarcina sp.]HOW13972.1 MarR family transcriptional regulator [Methanosarcina sp.]
MDEATLSKIILLSMERDALDNVIFEQNFQKKIAGKFKELSKNQPMVIKIIGIEGEIMPSTLGKYTGMEKSSLTRMVDDLEKKGIVFRKTDPDDRRKVLVSLTEKGLDCYNRLSQITTEMAEEILQFVDDEDVENFMHSLETMVKVMRKIDASRFTGTK